jgi:lauroyl/myristoyl acyltransferase
MLERPRILLHSRPARDAERAFWSGADTKFLLSAPILAGAAMFPSEAHWHRGAALIESLRKRVDKTTSDRAEIVCSELGASKDELRGYMARSDINRTVHLIHVMHSLLRPGWRPEFELVGREHLNDALAQGKGAVLWVAHMTFASLFAKMALSEAGYRLSHVSRPEHGVSKSIVGIRYLNRFRTHAENRYLSRRIVHWRHDPQATRAGALAALARNELLSVTVGAWEGRHLATGSLLGASYTVATGAAGLAFAGGTRILSVFTTRNAGGGYRVEVGAPLGEGARESREDFFAAAAQELIVQHEIAIRRAPDEWRGWSTLLSAS